MSELNDLLLGDYSQESIGRYINRLEENLAKEKMDAQIEAAKHANKQQYINFVVNFTTQRMTLEVLAALGLAKIDT